MTTSIAPASATTRSSPGSAAPPDTSLTIDRAGFERGGRDRRLGGVDAHGNRAVAGELPHHRQGATELFARVDGIGAGPGRLAADVEHRGAGAGQLEPVCDRRAGVDEAAAVGEGVGRDVHDPHERPPG